LFTSLSNIDEQRHLTRTPGDRFGNLFMRPPINSVVPERAAHGANPLQLDSRAPKIPIEQSLYLENRFKTLTKSKPEEARRLLEEARKDVQTRWRMYEYLAARKPDVNGGAPAGSSANDE
jgi:pyruvate-ferredoxin/flavodoxin oxidoreductase